jgi:D-ribose pyranose/furanose isomerase RbsD
MTPFGLAIWPRHLASKVEFEHDIFKRCVPLWIGVIRTGDSTAYGIIILESA